MKIHLVIDNIRSAYNVGSIFRSADGSGSTTIYVCGISPTPEHLKVSKTALGANETVEWKYFKTTQLAIDELKEKGIPIFSLETGENSVDYREVEYPNEFVLVVGHETEGVNPHILSKSDKIISIPMRGKKNSLNVANATSIILYEITKNVKN